MKQVAKGSEALDFIQKHANEYSVYSMVRNALERLNKKAQILTSGVSLNLSLYEHNDREFVLFVRAVDKKFEPIRNFAGTSIKLSARAERFYGAQEVFLPVDYTFPN
jgi:uncharacterized protein (UPF0276 family)